MTLTSDEVIAALTKRLRTLEDRVLKLERKNTDTETKGIGILFSLPDWVSLDSWLAYEDMRRGKKKVPTDGARKMIIKKLGVLREQGHDPNACLDQSSRMGWTDVYAVQEESNGLQRQAGGGEGRRRPEVRSFYDRAQEQGRQAKLGARALLGVLGGCSGLDMPSDKNHPERQRESTVVNQAEFLPEVEAS